MYLIITDHSTVRVVSLIKALLNIKGNFWFKLKGVQLTNGSAESTAKSIAIKENLVYTPQIEY